MSAVSLRSRIGLRSIALIYLSALLVVPVGAIFYRTFEHGLSGPIDAVTSAEGLHAFWLTIVCVGIAVPLNTVFGVITALVLVRQDFRGKALLNAAIDLPFAISPVVIGLALFLVYAPRVLRSEICCRSRQICSRRTPSMLRRCSRVLTPAWRSAKSSMNTAGATSAICTPITRR